MRRAVLLTTLSVAALLAVPAEASPPVAHLGYSVALDHDTHDFVRVADAHLRTLHAFPALDPEDIEISPDHRLVSWVDYRSAKDHTRVLFVAGVDGRGLRAMTPVPGVAWHPSWAPDSRHLAVASWSYRW